MIPIVAAQVHTVVEGLRTLEWLVTAPLGLYADIKMLRESLRLPEAADLSREETRERRTTYATLSDAPLEFALATIQAVGASMRTLAAVKVEPPPIEPEWLARARRVLDRAEQRVASDVRASLGSGIRGLYVIVDPEATNGRPVLEIAEATLSGGASVIQLRDKHRDTGVVLTVARRIKAMCEEHGAIFMMNDDASVALCSDAHGLHVGQEDLPVSDARQILASGQLVGRSNGTVDESMASEAEGADYVAISAIYATSTMGKSGRSAVGVRALSEAKERLTRPVVAIGGINAANIGEVIRSGADCICVVSAVTFADDPERETRRLVQQIEAAG